MEQAEPLELVPVEPSVDDAPSDLDVPGDLEVSGDLDELDECEATVVRVPGRHAARRRDLVDELNAGGGGPWSRWAERLSSLALAPAHLAVVAALVAGGLGVTCWWLVASDSRSQTVAAPVPVAENGPSADSSTTDAVAGTAPSAVAGVDPDGPGGEVAGEVVVDVAGKVRRPGIVVLPAGSRVADALEAAGGARRGVELEHLNLARILTDGEQILVGVEVPPGVANGAVSGTPEAPGASGGLVNINLADQALLETLPGVGPVTASAIIAWRTDNGGFRSVDDLLEVSGIGEATLSKLAPLVTL